MRFRCLTRYEISGLSMLPTLHPGDYVVVDCCFYKKQLPKVGEIVLALDPRDRALVIVKRVGGFHADGTIDLLGDNGTESTDSRLFGPVSLTAILGRVRVCYWPLSHFGYVR